MARGDAGAVIPAHYWRWAAAASIPVAWYIFSRRRRSAQDQRTDFDGFLKAVEPIGSTGSRAATRGSGTIDAFYKNAADVDTRNPVDFDSFIRGPKKASSGPQVGVATSAAAAAPAKPRPTPDHKPVLVMYGTEYGFSKEIAEKLCSSLAKQSGLWWVKDAAEPSPAPTEASPSSAPQCLCFKATAPIVGRWQRVMTYRLDAMQCTSIRVTPCGSSCTVAEHWEGRPRSTV